MLYGAVHTVAVQLPDVLVSAPLDMNFQAAVAVHADSMCLCDPILLAK